MRVRSVSTAAPTVDPAAPPPPGAVPRAPAPGLRDRVELSAAVAPPAAVARRTAPDAASLAGLAACVDEARAAALVKSDGPPDPVAFAALRARLEAASAKLPPGTREAFGAPLLRLLDRLGPPGFARVLREDPDREASARLLLDAAQAVLQHGEAYEARATAAFQEVVTDLYEGFLSAEDRRGVKPPDHGVVPPLVRWGSADAGPYTWPATATAALGVKGAVVSLPAANAAGGLLAWPALAHETAGHDVLEADDGLRGELAGVVRKALVADGMGTAVARYWAERIDETASDVLGVLNMGPAAAVGLVGYFRALNGAWSGTATLRTVGAPEDPHPADIARAYLAAETVRLLSFRGASRWADRLVAEADRDVLRQAQDERTRGAVVRLGGIAVTAGVAKASAAAVAKAIVETHLDALEGRAFGEIQNWRDRDEAVVSALRRALRNGAPDPGAYAEGAYAAHAVAAGVYEAVSGGGRPADVMDRMVGMLAEMHARNPAFPRLGAGTSASRVA